jgi:AcrR family transcriptional regulator
MAVNKATAPGRRKFGPRGSYFPEATRATLLEAAVALFGQRGFHATTVDQITDRAGVTKGAFYHHFESKEDVLRQIHAEYAEGMVRGARDVVAEDDQRPVDQLRALIMRAVVTLGTYSSHVAVFYQEYRFLSGKSYDAIRAMHDEEEAILLDVIERGKAAGELRPDVNPKLLMFAISGITAWTYQWYQETGPMTLDEIATYMADTILHGAVNYP